MQRTKNIGVISKDLVLSSGGSGPVQEVLVLIMIFEKIIHMKYMIISHSKFQ
ncbi:hypothetical protein CM15mP43_09090 [bacterium]|nr:MAG: hypothetical protein CM15mP43_09090 [bacterium]